MEDSYRRFPTYLFVINDPDWHAVEFYNVAVTPFKSTVSLLPLD